MKKKLIVMLLAILAIACVKTSDSVIPNNAFNYNSNNYEITKSYTMNYYKYDSNRSIFLTYLMSTGLTFSSIGGINKDTLTGKGNLLVLESINSSVTSLDLGTYTFDTTSYLKNTFNSGIMGFNHDFSMNTNTNIDKIVGGTYTVTQVSPNLVMSFNLKTILGKTVTGSFNGPNTFYNYSYLKDKDAMKRTNFISSLNRMNNLIKLK